MASLDQKCVNCGRMTPVTPPRYRCRFCQVSLKPKPSERPTGPSATPKAEPPAKPEPELPPILDLGLGSGSAGSGFAEEAAEDASGFAEIPASDIGSSGFENPPLLSEEPTQIEPPKLRKIENRVEDKQGKSGIAWLLLHTEGKEPAYYELFEGNNVFGRLDENHKVDIEIKDDRYVSRSHALIHISKDYLSRYHVVLLDDGSQRDGGYPSTNGTYLNGLQTRLPADARIFLQDGDTIQVGETKLVFKNRQESFDIKEAATSVMGMGYTKTVVVE